MTDQPGIPATAPAAKHVEIAVEGRIQQNSLLISLLARNWCGDWFAADCIVSQPVPSLGAMFRSEKFARHSEPGAPNFGYPRRTLKRLQVSEPAHARQKRCRRA